MLNVILFCYFCLSLLFSIDLFKYINNKSSKKFSFLFDLSLIMIFSNIVGIFQFYKKLNLEIPNVVILLMISFTIKLIINDILYDKFRRV